MKRLIVIISIVLGLLGVSGLVAASALKSHVIGSTLSAKDAEKRWGRMDFNEAKFKSGSIEERAKMASDLLTKRQLIGIPLPTIRDKLGEPTGYFWNDQIPAYLLNEGWKTDQDVWQLVFLPGKDGKVGDIIINKNCCEKSGSN